MKRSLIIILVSAMGLSSAFAGEENNQPNAQKKSYVTRAALFGVNGAGAAGTGLGALLFGALFSESLNEVHKSFKEFRLAGREYDALLKKSQELAATHIQYGKAIDEIKLNKHCFGSDTAFDSCIRILKNSQKNMFKYAEETLRHVRISQCNTIGCTGEFIGVSARSGMFGAAAAAFAYGTYWFGKNAFNQIRSTKK